MNTVVQIALKGTQFTHVVPYSELEGAREHSEGRMRELLDMALNAGNAVCVDAFPPAETQDENGQSGK